MQSASQKMEERKQNNPVLSTYKLSGATKQLPNTAPASPPSRQETSFPFLFTPMTVEETVQPRCDFLFLFFFFTAYI